MKLDIDKLDIEIIECSSFFSRLVGFMFKTEKIKHGLLFKECRSIHTFFMFQSIDVIMTDDNNNIVYMHENLKPFRMLLPKKGGKFVYEFPLKTIEKLK